MSLRQNIRILIIRSRAAISRKIQTGALKWVFGSARKPLGTCSDFGTCHDGASGSNSVWEFVARFLLFYKQNGAFWFAKRKASHFSFKDYFDRSIRNFQRHARQKPILVRSSSKFKLSLQHAGTRFNSKQSLYANITEWSLFNALAKNQVANCSTWFS